MNLFDEFVKDVKETQANPVPAQFSGLVDVFKEIYLPYRQKGFIHATVIEAFRIPVFEAFLLNQMYETHLVENGLLLPAPGVH